MNLLGNLFDPDATATCEREYDAAAAAALAAVCAANREDRDAAEARRAYYAAEHRHIIAQRLRILAEYTRAPGVNPAAEAHAAWVLESVTTARDLGEAQRRMYAHHCA